MPMPRRARGAGVLIAPLLAAACGTTVSTTGAASVQTAGGDELTASGPVTGNEVTGTGTTAGVAGSSTYGAAPGSGGASSPAGRISGAGSAAAVAPGTSAGADSGTTARPTAAGVTATKIYVGMIYAVNQDALNQAAGANGISVGDTKAEGNAIVDDINRHGGIAGRKLVPVWQSFDSTSTRAVDQQYASICSHFTQDNPRVFAAVGQGTASYRACLAKAGVVQLDADLPGISDAEFDKYPTLVEMGYPRLTRVAEAQLRAMVAQDYFAPWNTTAGAPAAAGKAKVGILTYDSPAFRAPVDRVLIPELKRLGYDPGDDVARISPSQPRRTTAARPPQCSRHS